MEEPEEKPTLLWWLYGPPLIALFCLSHFVVCVLLGIVYFGDEDKCRKAYEYYSPWGWGERRKP